MDDYVFPEVPEIEEAFRAAHRALESVIDANGDRGVLFAPEEDEPFFGVVAQFPFMVNAAEMVIASHLGPRVSWEGAPRKGNWNLIVAGFDFDGDREWGFDATLSESACEGDDGAWFGSPLNQAARAYQREAGWDFAPGDAGVWLLTLAPTSAIGGEDKMTYWGHVAGLAILYDRDGDGTYESVGHVWTPQAWRRRGIARRMLQEARERFGADRIEGPYTVDGAALVRTSPEFGKPGRPGKSAAR
jgi:ribosomal protein S18 acetylase RimI-like enzyme